VKCPFCHHPNSKVIDSRDLRAGESIRRRRECLNCGQRFTTYERVEPINLLVVKKDGTREEYTREKLSKGIYVAFTKRPIKAETIQLLIDAIESEIFRSGEAEVPSRRIGELTMEKLRESDSVAYIRFASVYQEFADLDAMRQEIEKLLLIERDSRDGRTDKKKDDLSSSSLTA
jgi:transcriptional repressor NrdR